MLGERAGPFAVIVVLLLRLIWTLTELSLAAASFLAYRLAKVPA